MKLIPNWKRTLTHGYGSWAVYAQLFIQVTYDNLSFLNEYLPAALSFAAIGAYGILRIIKQRSVSGDDA